MSIDLELGHDEIGCTGNPTMVVADDLVQLFAELGLPEPGPTPAIGLDGPWVFPAPAMYDPESWYWSNPAQHGA